MKIKGLNSMITIANQLEPEKIGKLRDRGYKFINCKRPDSEGEDQPGFDDIERIAKEHGIAARRIPIELTGAGPGHHAAFQCAV